MTSSGTPPAAPVTIWLHSQNYVQHICTTVPNIVGKDRDVGYGILPHFTSLQPFSKKGNSRTPFAAGLPRHAVPVGRSRFTTSRVPEPRRREAPPGRDRSCDAARQRWEAGAESTSLLFPAPSARLPVHRRGNATANLARGPSAATCVSFSISFCGHFPRRSSTFNAPRRSARGETRPCTGNRCASCPSVGQHSRASQAFHVLICNLRPPYRAPPLPRHSRGTATRAIARVRESLRSATSSLHTGCFTRQLGSVAGKIWRLALPPKTKVGQLAARLLPPRSPFLVAGLTRKSWPRLGEAGRRRRRSALIPGSRAIRRCSSFAVQDAARRFALPFVAFAVHSRCRSVRRVIAAFFEVGRELSLLGDRSPTCTEPRRCRFGNAVE